MKLVRPALDSFLRNKKRYIYFFSIVTIVIIFTNILYIQHQIDNIYSSKIENNIKNRTLSISKNKNPNQELDIIQINNINTINEVYIPAQNIEVIIDEKYRINLQSTISEQVPQIINGNNIRNIYEDIIEIVIPNKLEEEYNVEEILNSYVMLKYKNMEVNAKIVGIYDDVLNEKTAYISIENVTHFYKYNKDLIRENSYIAIVDDHKNVNNTIEQLENMGYSANIYNQTGQNDIKLYNMISNVLKILINLITLFIYILVSIIINSMIGEEKNDIAILKAIGYRNRDLRKIIFIRLIVISSISYGISFIISLAINYLINFIFFQIFNIKVYFTVLIHLRYTLIPLIIVLVVNILSTYANNKKIKNISIIDLLKDE